MKNKTIKEIIEKALLGTKMNFPDFGLDSTIASNIMKRIEAYKVGKVPNNNYYFIAVASEKYGVLLRSEVDEFCKSNGLDFYAELLKLSYKNYLTNESGENASEIVSICKKFMENYLSLSQGNLDVDFEGQDYYTIFYVLSVVISEYIESLDPNEVFKDVLKIETKESLYDFLTNVNGYKLMDLYSGKLLGGKIQLSTNVGFKDNHPQQDAVLSIVRKDDLFLNLVADGVAGSEAGEVASRKIVIEMKEWFESVPDEIFEDLELVKTILKEKLNAISQEINDKANGSYSTVALALTIKDKTIIASVGDSTVYSFDGERLVLLNELDLSAMDRDYEGIRRNPLNFKIKEMIGDSKQINPNINIIENEGQRIIISSDGVTDLVSEATFISYFINNSPADKIVDDALNNPEVMYEITNELGVTKVYQLSKKVDNISALVIDLPKRKVKKL